AAGLAGALWWDAGEKKHLRVARAAALGVCAYLLGGLFVLWPFNRALADFRNWYAKGAGLVVGMNRADVGAALRERAAFEVQDEGGWVVYQLKPSGRAGLHPFLGFSDADLFVLHVRYDPATKLAAEITKIAD
ncbi:MAG: hypothetical protein HY925_16780, partial [Elusimicrobia bacterium]|nr:hypothetical protein [Elusimicrobiota bacterium]